MTMKSEANNTRNTQRVATSLLIAVLAALPAAMALTGCATGSSDALAPTKIPGHALRGTVFGGQQPVTGATIQLYAAGTSGYGSASTPLISTVVTSDGGGDFSITGDYTCPSASSQVYITATGGNSGSSNNTNLALMAALGACGNLSSSTTTQVNELTTVGSVWALAQFMSGPSNVGTTSTNVAGLANAFADVNTLVDTSAGITPGAAVPAGATIPTAEINTLADILAACINSAGGAAGSSTLCGSLFTAATPSGGTAPADTITAALDIAKNPGHNVGTLYPMASSTAPFQPTLASAPNDFSIAVNFTGGNIDAPSALAADATGNIWITNQGNSTVTELAHSGSILSGPGGYTASFNSPSAIAFDTDGSVWITNKGSNTISRLNNNGGEITSYGSGGLSSPISISFDSLGDAWIANSNNSVTSISSSGGYNNYTPAGASTPIGIAVNPH
jgi:hypothetical protein